jgi:predicted nucleic acid-binding protein
MAAISAFVDTSGLFALLAKRDPAHSLAEKWLREARATRRQAVTTDYVLDETATLLKARGRSDLLPGFFGFVSSSEALQIEWMSPARFDETREFFLQHHDHRYSFTDCASFVTMLQLGLSEALTTDRHFRQAGFVPLLPIGQGIPL